MNQITDLKQALIAGGRRIAKIGAGLFGFFLCLSLFVNATGDPDDSGQTAAAVMIFFAACAYFVPTVVALIRRHHQTGAVVIVNLFLGWTVIGWVVALAMACSARRHAAA